MPEVEVDQKNCEYLPYATVMHTDQKIVFKSSDPVGHNIHYSGFQNNQNFVVAPNSSVTRSMVKDLVPVPLKCDIHPWMNGWIMVFDHPYFALTKADGSFEIKGVPAGTQNLVVRSGKMGYITKGAAKGIPVKVEAGKTTDLGDITLDAKTAAKALR
ncbi:MAG: carboxypeptidase regulatory-like domain-containing protein, partial [Isosphaeraceae bacterium]